MVVLRIACLSTLLTVVPALAHGEKPDGFPRVKHMIDTHIHLYDPRRPDGIPWPRAHDKVLYKPHLPAEFKKVSQPTGLTGVVIVEASDRLEDNRWVLDIVKDDDYFAALVGNINPYGDDFEVQLNKLKQDKRFVGVRARIGKPIDFSNPTVVKNYRTLAKAGLALDMLINGQGIEGIKQVDLVARQIPELRIVVNHVLGYNIGDQPPGADWIAEVEKLAKHPNVYCKVSGLYQRCVVQPASKDPEHYRALLDVLWKNFGEKRLIFGSNWPCTKNTGDYASFVRVVTSYFAEKGQEASERYFWQNANEAYRLGLK